MPTDGVHDPIPTSGSTDTRQWQLSPGQQVLHYAPFHRTEAVHKVLTEAQ